MAGVEIRKSEKVYGETGLGQSDRTEVSYDLGAEIDGVFIPFASVSETRVTDFKARAEAQAAQDAANKPTPK